MLRALGVAAGLAALAAVVVWLKSQAMIERRYPLPSTTAAASTTSKALLRGHHLILIAGCADCHGSDLEGRLRNAGSVLPVWSSNLTRQAHEMTDEEFERAVRTGIKPDSTSTWAMPAMDYTYMSEDDVVALLSYLRALPAAGTNKPDPAFTWRARLALLDGRIAPVAEEALESPASLDLGPRYDGGRYLARIACGDCHGTDLAGTATAPDLALVSRYTRAQFFALMRGGKTASGSYSKAMSRSRFHAFYDYEIDALYDYLSARGKVLKGR